MTYKCCEGERPLKFSRRYFLKQGGVAMVGMSMMPAFLQRAIAATPVANKKQMVVLFQRGAADGLNIVVPFAEPNYYRLRPTIAIPQPKRGTAGEAGNCRRSGDGPRWIFWAPSKSGATGAALSQESVGHCACRRLARSDAFAF